MGASTFLFSFPLQPVPSLASGGRVGASTDAAVMLELAVLPKPAVVPKPLVAGDILAGHVTGSLCGLKGLAGPTPAREPAP